MNKNLTVLIIIVIAVFFFLKKKEDAKASLTVEQIAEVSSSVAVAISVAELSNKPDIPNDLNNTGSPTGNVPTESLPVEPSVGSAPILPADEPADGRKVVYVYVSPDVPCINCKILERESATLKLDVCFLWRKGIPPKVQEYLGGTAYPLLHWTNNKGTGEFWQGWSQGDAKAFRSKLFETTSEETAFSGAVSKEKNEIPYPVRSSWWTFPGNSRADLIYHLRVAPEHRGKFDTAWLNTLSWDELMSLHSDDHEHKVRTYKQPKRRLQLFCPTCPT